MKYVPCPTLVDVRRRRAEGVGRVLGCDRRDRQDLPIFFFKDVTDKVVLVQSLHDDDDRALGLVVEAAIERVVVELRDAPTLGFRKRRGKSLDGVVDDDEVGATA